MSANLSQSVENASRALVNLTKDVGGIVNVLTDAFGVKADPSVFCQNDEPGTLTASVDLLASMLNAVSQVAGEASVRLRGKPAPVTAESRRPEPTLPAPETLTTPLEVAEVSDDDGDYDPLPSLPALPDHADDGQIPTHEANGHHDSNGRSAIIFREPIASPQQAEEEPQSQPRRRPGKGRGK